MHFLDIIEENNVITTQKYGKATNNNQKLTTRIS